MNEAVRDQVDALRSELRAICRQVSASGAGLVLESQHGEAPEVVTVGLPAELVEDYHYRYAAPCPLRRVLAGLAPGSLHTLDTLRDPLFAGLNEMQHGLLQRYEIRHIAIGHWHLPGGSVNFGFQRSAREAPFAADEIVLLERWTDALTSFRLGKLVAGDADLDLAVQGVFDLVLTPTLLLTAKGKLMRANPAAWDLVHRGSVLTVHGGWLQGVDSDTQVRLAGALEALSPGDHPLALRLAGRSCDWIAALRWVDARLPSKESSRQRYVLMQLSTPSSLLAVADQSVLGRLFGLTRAEEAVAWEIFSGHSVESAALAHNKGIATVKTQLNNAMHKLGVTRQAELVKWLAAIALLSLD